MKKFGWLMLVLIMSCVNIQHSHAQQKGTKMLVTYFSVPETDGVDASTGASRVVVDKQLYGTTEYVAKQIAALTGADVSEIKTVHTYPTANHKDLINYAKSEADSKIYPKITLTESDIDDYNVIFVGYPNWWYDMPMAIYTLFNQYDFSGKTIIPFCTHGGSGFSDSVETIKKLEKNATVIQIPAISRQNATRSEAGLKKWLTDNNFIK